MVSAESHQRDDGRSICGDASTGKWLAEASVKNHLRDVGEGISGEPENLRREGSEGISPIMPLRPSRGWLSTDASTIVTRMVLRFCLRRRPVDGSSLMPRPATFPSMPLHKCFYRHPADGSPLIPSLRSHRTLSAVIFAAFPSMTVRLSLRRVPTARSPLIPSRPFSRWSYSDVFGAFPPHALRC
jgi:hypothetical protein